MVEFSIGCPDRKDRFELGDGAWGWSYRNGGVSFNPSIEELLTKALHRDDCEAFARYVVRVWNLGVVEPGQDEWIRDVGRRLFNYCAERSWKVIFIPEECEAYPDWWDWRVVDSRHEDQDQGIACWACSAIVAPAYGEVFEHAPDCPHKGK